MENAATPIVRWGDWISEGWRMFAEQWQAWVVHMLVYFLILLIPMAPFYAAIIALNLTAARGQEPQPPVALFLLVPVLILVLLLASAYLMGGSYYSAFKQLRGERIELRDLFSGGRYFPRMVGALLLIGVLGILGAMLCVIPAFIVGGLFFFTLPLIVDRNLGVLEAMRASRELTQQNLFMFTLFAFVVSLLSSLGAYACYVGLLVSYPLLFTITVVAYRDCFGVPGARSFALPTPPPPPNYGAPPPQWPAVCPNCQAAVPANAAFCARCGGRVRA